MPNYHKDPIEKYHEYFNHCSSNQNIKVLIEATADYIYQDTPVNIFPFFEKKPFIIFLLRNPADRVYSYYKFAKYRLSRLAKEITFDRFLALVKAKDPILNEHKNLANIIDYSKYYKYIEKYEQALGKENMLVYQFELLKNNPQYIMNDLCSKIGIDPEFYNNYIYKKKNESYQPKFQIFQNVYNWLPIPYKLRYQDNLLKSLVKKAYYSINIKSVNKNKEEKSAKDIMLLNQLDEYFTGFNNKLEDKYGIDLSLWQRNKHTIINGNK